MLAVLHVSFRVSGCLLRLMTQFGRYWRRPRHRSTTRSNNVQNGLCEKHLIRNTIYVGKLSIDLCISQQARNFPQ